MEVKMFRPVVFLASPYTKTDQSINANFQCKIFDQLLTEGKVWPIAPLWSHFQHTIYPRKYEDWIEYDQALLSRYDACLRLNVSTDLPGGGHYEAKLSTGADNEVAAFKRMGKPVFFAIPDLYKWVEAGRNNGGIDNEVEFVALSGRNKNRGRRRS